jgi:hypothetical protein
MQWLCSESKHVCVATGFDSRVCTAAASRVVEGRYDVTGVLFALAIRGQKLHWQ